MSIIGFPVIIPNAGVPPFLTLLFAIYIFKRQNNAGTYFTFNKNRLMF
jgi:hypothetical protein